MKPRFTWKRLSWPTQIIVWFFSFYTLWIVLPKGFEKLANLDAGMNFFGLPFAIYVVVGIIEGLAPLLMFIPKISFYGAFSILVVMAAASYITYNPEMDFWTMISNPPLLIAILAFSVAVLTRPGLLRISPNVTKISV